MSRKIALFCVILVVFSVLPAWAQPQGERKDIICASLDAIECRLDGQETLPSPSQTQVRNHGFFSDFSFTSPILDALSLYRRFSFPILCFNDDEELTLDLSLEDLPETISLSDESEIEDFIFLDSLGEKAVELYLGAHYGYLGGHTLYQISFDGGKSELEFPLESWSVLGVRFAANFPKSKLLFENTGYISTNDESGDMYDSDWGADDVLTSDTVSDAYLKLLIWDTSLGYTFWNNLYADYGYNEWNVAFTALGGYRHEYFKYMIYNLYNTSRTICTNTGPVLKYRVTYNIPYLGLKINLAKPQADWGIGTRFCFSPFVRAKDFDDHLLRDKRTFGECRGWAAMVGANLFYHLNDSWTLQGGVDYANIRTAGEQTQEWYGDDPAGAGDETGSSVGGIDDNIYSNQLYYWGRINYQF